MDSWNLLSISVKVNKEGKENISVYVLSKDENDLKELKKLLEIDKFFGSSADKEDNQQDKNLWVSIKDIVNFDISELKDERKKKEVCLIISFNPDKSFYKLNLPIVIIYDKITSKELTTDLSGNDKKTSQESTTDLSNNDKKTSQESITNLSNNLHNVEIAGIFQKDKLLRDLEDLGNLVAIIKNKIRLKLEEDHPLASKEINWKILRTDDSPSEDKKDKDNKDNCFLTFYLDKPIREFMNEFRIGLERAIKSFEKIRKKIGEKIKDNKREMSERVKEWLNSKIEGRKNKEDPLDNIFLAGSKEGYKIYTPYHIILEGETGTGKSFLVKYIVDKIYQKKVAHLNCSNLSKELFETELFGSVKGAYTDSITNPGILLTNVGGIVFLDEIGDMPEEIQAKFLVYLENFTLRPVGWVKEDLFSPVLIISATNKDIKELIRQNKFREDLYYRFRIKLKVPPLKERKADIKMLISFLLQDKNINREKIERISYKAIQALIFHDFRRGNFRELEAILRTAVDFAVDENSSILKEKHIIKALYHLSY